MSICISMHISWKHHWSSRLCFTLTGEFVDLPPQLQFSRSGIISLNWLTIFSLQAGKLVDSTVKINSVRNTKNTIRFWEAISERKKWNNKDHIRSYWVINNIECEWVEVCVDTGSQEYEAAFRLIAAKSGCWTFHANHASLAARELCRLNYETWG